LIDNWIGKHLRTLYRQRIARTPEGAVGLDRTAVVFAPHQDDEILGCGGTVLLKRKAGAEVKVVFLTDGRTSHSHFIPAGELVQMREQEAVNACLSLGLAETDIHFLRFPDSELANFHGEAVQRVSEILCQHRPAEVYLPYFADPQPDHIATNQIVMQSLRSSQLHGTVFEFPVWYWFHWPWISAVQKAGFQKKRLLKNTLKAYLGLKILNEFRCSQNIQSVLAEKRDALDQHKSQMSEIIPGVGWPTLPGVAGGDWLDCFFQPKEIFRLVTGATK
jgi:LmbE family N-acetylglucosaminyl deacetylase